ncbi:MAG: anti-sigma factor domain-containing protein [Demequina sp.]|uniref:anti-sigma factor domain-containing protein n=1 Tax=Demequina sp. TaxID=2050685 RepID=UPI003A845820
MNENLHTLAASYAIDALDPAERDEFEAHLADCAECRDEVASLALAVEELATSHEVTPPASLRSSVMARIERTAQVPPLLAPPSAPAAQNAPSPDAPAAPAGTTAASDVRDTRFARGSRSSRPSRSGASRRWWIAAPVAAVTVAVLVVGGVMIADARADRSATVALEREALEVAAAADMESMVVELGSGKVMVSAEQGSVALLGSAAPLPEAGTEYQVWLVMADGSVLPGPTFVPHDDGTYVAVAEGDIDALAAVALTVEPSGGSEAPTTDPFAVSEMPAQA